MPEIHDALARAVANRPNRRRWWHPSRRAGVLAAGALTITGTAVAATADWRPVLGGDDRGHPRIAHGSLPSEQLAELAVLRRPQTESDRGADVKSSLRLLVADHEEGVHTDGIRVLRRDADQVTMLVPNERVGTGSRAQDQVLCVTRYVPSPPPVTVKDGNGKPQRVSLGGNGSTCGDVRQLRTTGIGWSNGRLVPDGVAQVVVRLRGNRHVTVPVHDNYYEVETDELLPAWSVRWLDDQGNTIDHRRDK